MVASSLVKNSNPTSKKRASHTNSQLPTHHSRMVSLNGLTRAPMRMPSQCSWTLSSQRGFDPRHTNMPTTYGIAAQQKPYPESHPMKPFMARNPVFPPSTFSVHAATHASHPNTAPNSTHTPSMEFCAASNEDPKPTRSGSHQNTNLLFLKMSSSTRKSSATPLTQTMSPLPTPLRARGCPVLPRVLLRLRE